jgi:iron complex outermembrane receptor protein
VGTALGTATDQNGRFEFPNLTPGEYILEISMIGYSKYRSGTLSVFEAPTEINVYLNSSTFEMDQVVVTASKYRQDLSELPVSASLINSDDFSRRNFVKLDDALRYVPGVNVTLDQVSIRGSSGYSRGAGTRVLVAIDGIPLYTGDTGEIIWEIVPVTELKRVEIIKGSSSSIYGSTAIGGVINVITKEITSRPITYFRSYFGVYDKPSYEEWDWADGYRTFNGITAAHTNRIGKLGFSVSLSRTENSSYRQNDWLKRYSGYVKALYNFNSVSTLKFLFNGYTQDRGTFNFWKDSRNALVPPDNDQGQNIPSDRLLYALALDNVFSEKFSLKINSSYYRTVWKDASESANSANTNFFRAEVQTDYRFDNNLHLFSGIEGSYTKTTSSIFSDPDQTGFGAYTQAEYRFEFPLILTAGLRYDYGKLDTLQSQSSISPKFGLNYKLGESTILRSSIGKGFRYPTIAEAYTSTQTSGIPVKQNLTIKPETGYSFEIGVNQSVGDYLNLDAALFQSEYKDFIEPRLDTTEIQNPFIIFDNVAKAKIQGAEINSSLNLAMINTQLNIGYTYLWARDVEKKEQLKYRPRHLLYAKAIYRFNSFEFGANFRFWSEVEEIDEELVEFNFVIDGDKRVPVYVLDLTAGYYFFRYGLPLKLYLNANNILNYYYIEMIGNISPIRNISLNLELVL